MRGLSALAVATALLVGLAPPEDRNSTERDGVLRSASLNGNWPFGVVDHGAERIAELDINSARSSADTLAVNREGRPSNPANRFRLRTSGQVERVPANVTVTCEGAEQLDLCVPYFASGQKYLAKRGTLSSSDPLTGLRIGADSSTVNAILLCRAIPIVMLTFRGDFLLPILLVGSRDRHRGDGTPARWRSLSRLRGGGRD